jgi:hypothetical protein
MWVPCWWAPKQGVSTRASGKGSWHFPLHAPPTTRLSPWRRWLRAAASWSTSPRLRSPPTPRRWGPSSTWRYARGVTLQALVQILWKTLPFPRSVHGLDTLLTDERLPHGTRPVVVEAATVCDRVLVELLVGCLDVIGRPGSERAERDIVQDIHLIVKSRCSAALLSPPPGSAAV